MTGMKKAAASGYCSDSDDQSNLYAEDSDINRDISQHVVSAEKWQCPLESQWELLYSVGIGHQGVVVRLEDLTQYLVHKLPSTTTAGVGDVVVAYASGMGFNGSRFDQKQVQKSTLGDYLAACGYSYNTLTDNCIHAVNRMWELN